MNDGGRSADAAMLPLDSCRKRNPFQVWLKKKYIGAVGTAEMGALLYARAIGAEASAAEMADYAVQRWVEAAAEKTAT